MNFAIYFSNFLNNLGIKYNDIKNNREKILEEIKQKYPNDKNLIWAVTTSIDFWFLPIPKGRVFMEYRPGSMNVRHEEPDFEDYFKTIQDFWVPEPEFCKKFLMVGQKDPTIEEVSELFFNRLDSAEKVNKNKVVTLFNRAIEAFKRPMDRDYSIMYSRYLNTIIDEEDLRSLNLKNILNSFMDKKKIMAELNEDKKKSVVIDAVDILYKLLEGSLKIILAVIFNFNRIMEDKNLVPFDRYLGSYTRKLNLNEWNSVNLRNSIAHFISHTDFESGYDIEIDDETQEIYVIFPKENIKYSFDELFSLIQILNANISMFRIFMESYILENELNLYKSSIAEAKKQQRDQIINLIKAYRKKINLYNEGVELIDLQDFKGAIKLLDKVLDLDPYFDHSWFYKGYCLVKLEKNKEAVECFDKALSINPNNKYSWNNKGAALQTLKKFQEANNCYNKALEIDHNFGLPYFNKACIEIIKNNTEESLKLLKKAVELDSRCIKLAEKDPDFDNIRNTIEFKNIIKGNKNDNY